MGRICILGICCKIPGDGERSAIWALEEVAQPSFVLNRIILFYSEGTCIK